MAYTRRTLSLALCAHGLSALALLPDINSSLYYIANRDVSLSSSFDSIQIILIDLSTSSRGMSYLSELELVLAPSKPLAKKGYYYTATTSTS